MSDVRTPKGLFHVREPLDELLDRSGRYLASMGRDRQSEPIVLAVRAAEGLARQRLTADAGPGAVTANLVDQEAP